MPEDEVSKILIEQYKLYVEMTDKVSERRLDANKLYTTLLTALLAIIPFAFAKDTPPAIHESVLASLGILGLALCVLWVVNIRSYRQLNSLKFRVIHEMEQRLPFPCYEREWHLLSGEKEKQGYFRLSRIEQYIPLVLMIPFLILLAYVLVF